MPKVLLHYSTELGGCTVVVEIGDLVRANAIMRAHQALGEIAAIVEEIPRYSLKEHMAKHKRDKRLQAVKASKKATRSENVIDLRRTARKSK